MKERAKVILVQPLGVRDEIYPWGIHLIGDHLEENVSDATVKRLLLQRDRTFGELFARHRSLADSLLALLNPEAQRPFVGYDGGMAAYNIAVYAAWLGSGFLDHLRRHECYVANGERQAASLADGLDSLSCEFLQLLDARIAENCSSDTDNRLVWGISVYDRTLFFCLSLVRYLRQKTPGASIVLGGDYFTFENAKILLRASSLADGVVVGYGEDTMRLIVESLQQGEEIAGLAVRGFVNAHALTLQEPESPIFPDKDWVRGATQTQTRIQVVNVPSTYKATSQTAVRYVRHDDAAATNDVRVLRVMFQRGCSYGKCTFCTQIDKKLYFRLNHQDILKSLAREIAATKMAAPRANIKISFDADEHSPLALLDIMTFLSSDEIDDDVEIFASLWFQTKYMNPRIARAIAAFKKKNVHLVFVMNFETLNPITLELMDKGHSPLTAIFGAKAIQDAGQYFVTNYMEFFPRESEDNVAEELKFLHRSLHLIAGKVNLFPYAINGRDEIFQNQNKFGVRAQAFAKDLWIRDVFDVDLETSFWNYRFDLTDCSDVTRSWCSYLTNRSESTRSQFEKAASREHATAYLQRAHHFDWLQSMRNRPIISPSPISMRITERAGIGHAIHKDYRAAVGSEREIRPLSADELRFLRFLYQPRKWSEVLAEFRDSISEEPLLEMKRANQRFGSVVEYEEMLLCTANDSHYVSKL